MGAFTKFNVKEVSMSAPDTRCCGSGVCIINPQGECWCGQVWNGEKMAHPALKTIESKDDATDNFTNKPHLNE